MSIGLNLGIITPGAITNELVSRGIRVEAAPTGVTPIIPLPIVTPPITPEEPVTVIQPVQPGWQIEPYIDHYEPYIPIYPPTEVSPEDVTLPYIPVRKGIEPEKKGLDKTLLIVLGIAAFGVMMFARQAGPGRDEYKRRRRF